jgi:hypothetical protein
MEPHALRGKTGVTPKRRKRRATKEQQKNQTTDLDPQKVHDNFQDRIFVVHLFKPPPFGLVCKFGFVGLLVEGLGGHDCCGPRPNTGGGLKEGGGPFAHQQIMP